MTPARLAPAERSAFRQFVDALRAFSDDQGPANLVGYLAASRALEESRRSGETPGQTRPRTKRSSAVARKRSTGAISFSERRTNDA